MNRDLNDNYVFFMEKLIKNVKSPKTHKMARSNIKWVGEKGHTSRLFSLMCGLLGIKVEEARKDIIKKNKEFIISCKNPNDKPKYPKYICRICGAKTTRKGLKNGNKRLYLCSATCEELLLNLKHK